MTDRFSDTRKNKGLYRSRNGVIFGVCRGVADHFDISAFWLRVILVVAFLMTGFFPVVVAYIVTALILKPEPVVPFQSASDRDFYDTYTHSRAMAVERLKRTFDRIDARVRRMESIVTSRDFKWQEGMKDV